MATTLPANATKQYFDEATDDPKQARVELADHIEKFNDLKAALGQAALVNLGSIFTTTSMASGTPDTLGIDTGTEPGQIPKNSDLGSASKATQAFLLDRDNHTGTQALSTITGRGTAAAYDVGTGSNQLPRNSDLPPAPVFTSFYESSEQSVPAGSRITLSHGLGGKPRGIRLIAHMTASYGGYSAGWEIDITSLAQPFSGFNEDGGISVRYTSSALVVVIGASGRLFGAPNYSNGAREWDFTNSNVNLIVQAWR